MKRSSLTPCERRAYAPAPPRRSVTGFSLVELLTVVAIIGLLASMVIPSLQTAKAVARTVICAKQLHDIGVAFHSDDPRGTTTITRPYPNRLSWPANPQHVVPDREIYFCPEQKQEHVGGGGTLGVHINFGRNDGEVEGLCEIVDRSDLNPPSDEYWFDDGLHKDVDDYVFLVTKDPPRTAKFMEKAWQGKYKRRGSDSGDPDRLISLCLNRKPIDGWENFRTLDGSKEIALVGGGDTNYGINGYADRIVDGSHKIVLLDFRSLVATDEAAQGQDERAVRRRGRPAQGPVGTEEADAPSALGAVIARIRLSSRKRGEVER